MRVRFNFAEYKDPEFMGWQECKEQELRRAANGELWKKMFPTTEDFKKHFENGEVLIEGVGQAVLPPSQQSES